MERQARKQKSNATFDMTNGNLFRKIILFALPVMGTTAMQLLYVTIDLLTVHYGDSAESMGAIASNNALINLIVVVFTGVSLGVNVIMSEAKGAGRKEKAESVMHTSLLFALISGFAVGVLGFFVSDDLLRLMGTEEHYFAKAALYLKIYFTGLPFLMIYNYAAQMLRAQGDSQTPFFILTISGIINVAFDCLFVFPFKMGVAGVGLATVISEGISAVLGVLALAKGRKAYVRFSFKRLRIDGPALREILRVGLPAGLQGFFFSLPNVFIQSSLYTIDPGNVALENGATASSNIEGYFHTAVDAICTSVMTFVAANAGAKNKENIKKVALYGLLWGSFFVGIIALVTAFLYRPLLSLFVDGEESIAAGHERLRVMGYLYFFELTMHLTASILRGLRYSVLPMISTLVFCTGFRIVLILTVFPLPYFHTVMWLYALFPITWLLATLSNSVGLIVLIPKAFRKMQPKPEASASAAD